MLEAYRTFWVHYYITPRFDMSIGTNFPGQNRSSFSRRAFQLIQKDEESQGCQRCMRVAHPPV